MMVEKSLASTFLPEGDTEIEPAGIAALIEIEVPEESEPTITLDPDGGMTIELDGEGGSEPIGDIALAPHDANLLDYLPDSFVDRLGSELQSQINSDEAARSNWLQLQTEGIALLGLSRTSTDEPWPGAASATMPTLMRAMVTYQSDTIKEIFPATGPAEIQRFGSPTREQQERDMRVKAELNYYCTVKMPGFRTSLEATLLSTAYAGSAFRKVYQDPRKQRADDKGIEAKDLILPAGTTSLEEAPRYTHRQVYDKITWLQTAGPMGWRVEPLPQAMPPTDDVEDERERVVGPEASYEDDEFEVYEIYTHLVDPELIGDSEVPLPFIVVLDKPMGKIRSIRRNWREDDPTKQAQQSIVQYQFIPGFGPYGLGMLHLLGGLTEAGSMLLRQIIDANTLNNVPSGFKTKGMRIKGDDTPIQPGEFRDVDMINGTSIRDNIEFLPSKPADPTSLQLLQLVGSEADRLASVAQFKSTDASGAAAGAMFAVLERAMSTQSAAQARAAAALGRELDLLRDVIGEYGGSQYEHLEGISADRSADFRATRGVRSVADPAASSQAMRVLRNQAAVALSSQSPDIYDKVALHQQAMRDLGYDNADKLVPSPEDVAQRDPISENMAVLQNKPVKAFLDQDHQAHLVVHMQAVQDPTIREIAGQSPTGPSIQAAMAAHIMEHLSMLYWQKTQEAMGFELPPPGEALPADVENQIARMAAQAQVQLTLALPGAPPAQPDPLVQIQQREMALKEAEVALKARQQELDMEKARMQQETARLQDDTRKQIAALQAAVEQLGIETKARQEIVRANTQASLDSAEILRDSQALGFEQGAKAAELELRRQEIDNTRARSEE